MFHFDDLGEDRLHAESWCRHRFANDRAPLTRDEPPTYPKLGLGPPLDHLGRATVPDGCTSPKLKMRITSKSFSPSLKWKCRRFRPGAMPRCSRPCGNVGRRLMPRLIFRRSRERHASDAGWPTKKKVAHPPAEHYSKLPGTFACAVRHAASRRFPELRLK